MILHLLQNAYLRPRLRSDLEFSRRVRIESAIPTTKNIVQSLVRFVKSRRVLFTRSAAQLHPVGQQNCPDGGRNEALFGICWHVELASIRHNAFNSKGIAVKTRIFLLGLAILAFAALLPTTAKAQQPVVRAVLFYSPACGHCHYVIEEVLPPLMDKYGALFQIVGVNTTSPAGQAFYQAAIERFAIPDARRGVPTLILGSTVLVGSTEIPEQLPILIDQNLANGGLDWPDIPGFAEALAAEPTPAPAAANAAAPAAPASTAAQAASTPSLPPAAAVEQPAIAVQEPYAAIGATNDPGAEDLPTRLLRSPVANGLAIVLLLGMLGVLGLALTRLIRAWPGVLAFLAQVQLAGWRSWAIAALCLAGLGVSLYMAFVETTRTEAICGPVGDCNAVQQSPYALLFGWLPIGVLGVLGYAAMFVAWIAIRWGRGNLRDFAAVGLWGMALLGTLFSIYLTFLEPFVIGAVCAWCLTSALCMALILLILAASLPSPARPAAQAAQRQAA
jgi:uncharacterized membrane protein